MSDVLLRPGTTPACQRGLIGEHCPFLRPHPPPPPGSVSCPLQAGNHVPAENCPEGGISGTPSFPSWMEDDFRSRAANGHRLLDAPASPPFTLPGHTSLPNSSRGPASAPTQRLGQRGRTSRSCAGNLAPGRVQLRTKGVPLPPQSQPRQSQEPPGLAPLGSSPQSNNCPQMSTHPSSPRRGRPRRVWAGRVEAGRGPRGLRGS